LGGPSDVDVRALPSEINARRIIVTQDKVMGKTWMKSVFFPVRVSS
jgi:hypothetical protein